MAMSLTDRMADKPETQSERSQRNATFSNAFTLLGFDHGLYYYLPRGSNQIVALRARQHVESELYALADATWWETSRYSNSGKVAWKSAASDLVCRQHLVGIYNASRLRGRGAWWDKDHAVVHVGDKIIINGTDLPLSTPSKYVYESSLPYPISPENPLDRKSAYALIDICKLISWEKPINAYYLAGWTALAPVGGALNWRPHVWVVAAAESGKSTIVRDIVGRILSGIAIGSQSCTTEPAIRGELNNGSLPVIFDEAESKSKTEKLRMDAVVGLARAASTEGGDPIMKSNPDGTVRKTYIRSMFLFSSISYPLTKPEDMRRITPLGIIKDGNLERYEKLKALIARKLTDEFCARFSARSIKMIPIIRTNARIFASVLVNKFNSQGLGDQYGMLLAGAWSLFSDDIVTLDTASKWITEQDMSGAWIEQKIEHSEDTDESQCLSRIKEHVIRAQSKSGPVDRSVAELADVAAERSQDDILSAGMAADILGRHGIRSNADAIIISVSHAGVAGILKDTQWARNWSRILRRLPGAIASQNPVRFGAVRGRAVEIPHPDDPY